jgi:hypothetical protein
MNMWLIETILIIERLVKLYAYLADFQFPILPWEEFLFVEPCVHAVLGQAGVECADGVTVRVGVAEEDFEGAVHKG